MEQQVKAEFDSLMAIYDPWEAIKGDRSQKKNIQTTGTTINEIFESLKSLDQKYPHSAMGDLILHRILMLHLEMMPSKDTIIGTLPAKHNPKYREHYNESMRITLRLADEYPASPYAEKMLFWVGIKYAGFLDVRDGKYIKPYIELVKRYPNSRFIVIALLMISDQAEFETEDYAPDFITRMWAYSLWREKYDDQIVYLNVFDDPKMEALYSDPKNKHILSESKEIINREKREIGISLLGDISASIGHSLEGFFSNNESIYEINTNNPNKIYQLLKPYCWDTDVFKNINPFEAYPEIKIVYFYANRDRYKYKLRIFDVEREWSADKSVSKPERR